MIIKGINCKISADCIFWGKLCLFVSSYLFLSVFIFALFINSSFADENKISEEIIDESDYQSSDDLLLDIINNFKENEQTRTDDVPNISDEKKKVIEIEKFNKDEASFFNIDGSLKLSSCYNIAHKAPKEKETDWRGLSRLNMELQLDLNVKFSKLWRSFISTKANYDFAYLIKGKDEFTNDVLDNYEKELELNEAYIRGTLFENIDLKFGRQIVVWGKSDYIRVTDVLNPLDVRESGLTDIEDLRLPLTMTRFDYYIGKWNFGCIAIHEISFNKVPEYGSDFYPADVPPIHEDKPNHGGKNTEFALTLNGTFSGWDIALYYADIFDDISHVETVSTNPYQIEMKHSRLKFFGAAFNIVRGNWLLKAEAAHFSGIEFFRKNDKTYSRTDILAGIEYSGFDDTAITIEAVNRHINNFETILKEPPDQAQKNEFQSVFKLGRTFLNETLTLTLLASTFDFFGDDGAFQRITAEYELTDAVQITGGAIFYQSGDLARNKDIGDNDRLFFDVKYSF